VRPLYSSYLLLNSQTMSSYAVLGITPDATEDEIRSAYKRKVLYIDVLRSGAVLMSYCRPWSATQIDM
jgi:hypothetical protein